jgi:hypothetical protein
MDNFIRYITGNTMILKTEALAATLQLDKGLTNANLTRSLPAP